MDKRRPEMDTNGFHGDTFSGGWGDFYPAGKRAVNPKFPFMIGGDTIGLTRNGINQVSLGDLHFSLIVQLKIVYFYVYSLQLHIQHLDLFNSLK